MGIHKKAEENFYFFSDSRILVLFPENLLLDANWNSAYRRIVKYRKQQRKQTCAWADHIKTSDQSE